MKARKSSISSPRSLALSLNLAPPPLSRQLGYGKSLPVPQREKIVIKWRGDGGHSCCASWRGKRGKPISAKGPLARYFLAFFLRLRENKTPLTCRVQALLSGLHSFCVIAQFLIVLVRLPGSRSLYFIDTVEEEWASPNSCLWYTGKKLHTKAFITVLLQRRWVYTVKFLHIIFGVGVGIHSVSVLGV
jgi:hypothetical protein